MPTMAGGARRWLGRGLATSGGFAPLQAATLDQSTDAMSAAAAHPAFEVVRDETVDEYGVRATMYKHIKSGAEVLSVVADDENKVGHSFILSLTDSFTCVPLCMSRAHVREASLQTPLAHHYLALSPPPPLVLH